MTLLDMYHYDKDVLSPISGYNYKYLNGIDLVNYLLTVYSLTECGYNEPPLFKEMCTNFMSIHDRDIKRIIDNLDISDNVNMTGFGYSRNTDSNGSGSGSGSSEGESRVSAFNSDSYQPDSETVGKSRSDSTYTDKRKETYHEDVKARETLESVEMRLSLAKNNIYVTIAGWFADDLLICVW